MTRSAVLLSVALVMVFAGLTPLAAVEETPAMVQSESAAEGPESSEAVTPTLSPRLDSLPSASVPTEAVEARPRQNPLADEPDQGARGTWDRTNIPLDPLIDFDATATGSRTPNVGLSFDGIGNPTACGGCSPPDTNGDVGPDHYVQMVNATKVAIWNKTGTQLLAPVDLGTFWSTGTCTGNAGDPIVVYDPLADRWVLSQFATPNHMCFAVSTSGDPTGTYHLYTFDVGAFPDYFKLGVWPDGYYMSSNDGSYSTYAFERTAMISGNAATFQKFAGTSNLLLPSDLDGSTAPPAGAPNHFYTFKDNSFHGGTDRIELWDFHVDWANPGNSTFGLATTIPVASFTYTACGFFDLTCIPQGGTTTLVDQVGEWPMWRFAYRNFGTHQALVGNFGIGGGTGEVGSAIRWFELQSDGGAWTLHQEGTHDLNDGLDRWMGSIAQDQSGNIAIGYSASDSSNFPSIRYATRLATDPLGTMGPEKILQAGGGSQTVSNRWGDYSAMTVDPVDDCTFWFTTEYYAASSGSNWSSRIGNFVEPTCEAPPVEFCNGLAADIVGTSAGETINGTPGPDVIVAKGGSDTINGFGGNDVICAGNGNDVVEAGSGNDYVDGGSGNDEIHGGKGGDTLKGGDGSDELVGDAGDDTLRGDKGSDVLRGGDGKDVLKGHGGSDTIYGDADGDTLFGGNGADELRGGGSGDTIEGDDGADAIFGGNGADTLKGLADGDTIEGGKGSDTIKGGGGSDDLYGKAGNDDLFGNSGNDLCAGGKGSGDTADATCETITGVP